ncbi:hypothetical protein ACOJQI_11065 [Bacillus salacetis]|uniref:hypothetical protein n=1 Tax=Bacillus salacetis TaxID=2315464 RepID=UPI003BA36B58
MRKFKSFLIFFIPFLLFFFYFTNQNEHNSHMTANSSHSAHGFVEIPAGYEPPSVKIVVTQDQSKSWLLEVRTENFTFTPKKAGTATPSYNEGHAHLYINGKKINRLYGRYYNLGMLKQGENKIKVTLNSNNHGTLKVKGKIIENSAVAEVASK